MTGLQKWRGTRQCQKLGRMTAQEREHELQKLRPRTRKTILDEMITGDQNTRTAALTSMSEVVREEVLGTMSPDLCAKTVAAMAAPCGKIRAMKGLSPWAEVDDKIQWYDPYPGNPPPTDSPLTPGITPISQDRFCQGIVEGVQVDTRLGVV